MNNLTSREYARRALSGFPEYTAEGHDKLLREELAYKVISGAKLTADDKKTIYRLLTGNKATVARKGRPSSKDRDLRLAMDFLTMKFEGGKKVNAIIKKLGKAHGLPGLESVQPATFYKALNKGIDWLEGNVTRWLEAIEAGRIEDTPDRLTTAKKYLEWITSHRAQQIP